MKIASFARYMILLLPGVILLAACARQPDQLQPIQATKVIYASPELVNCQGAAPQKCMLVKEDPNADYQLFYGQIEGFDYEAGYDYVLLVQEEDISVLPAEASNKKWGLVSIISKTPAKDANIAQLSIEGSLWRLISYTNAKGSLSDILPSSEITAEFKDRQVNGSAGCNQYFASYQANGEQFTINGAGATMMFCSNPAGIMDQEADYLAALEQTVSYNIADDRLQMVNAQGQTILIYIRIQPLPLSGVNWELVSYNNGKGAMVSTLTGSRITALFKVMDAANGALTGSSGCNQYNTTYEKEGIRLQIRPAVATRMACAEPDGVMEQESEYLAALQQAYSFVIKNKELQVFDAQGAYLLVYQAP